MDDAEIGEFAVSNLLFTLYGFTTDVCKYDFVEFTRDVVNGGELLDDDSKYSADRDSPIPHEKAFSSSVGDEHQRSR